MHAGASGRTFVASCISAGYSARVAEDGYDSGHVLHGSDPRARRLRLLDLRIGASIVINFAVNVY